MNLSIPDVFPILVVLMGLSQVVFLGAKATVTAQMEITKVFPLKVKRGENLSIFGLNFGKDRQDVWLGTRRIGSDDRAHLLGWSDGRIDIKIPEDIAQADGYEIMVTKGGSSKVAFKGGSPIIIKMESNEYFRKGTLEPLGNNTITLTGILTGGTAGTPSQTASVYDTTEGLCIAYTTAATANLNVGYVSPTVGIGVGRRLTNLRMKSRSKVDSTTSCRFYMGFTNLTTLPITDTPLGSADQGVIIGFNSTDGYYTVRHNDGTSVATHVTSVPKDANFHSCEVEFLPNGNCIISLDDTAVATLTTKLPAPTTNLFFNCVAQTTSTIAITHTIRYIEGEADR
jgi:hypothetical protein